MRIAVVEPSAKGGLVHYAFALCRALAEEGAADGLRVTLVTGREYELSGVEAPFEVRPVLRLWDPKPAAAPAGRRRPLRRLWRAAVYFREQVRLVLHLRRLRPDVVQLGDVRFAGDLGLVLALAACRLPLADVCHNVDPYRAGRFGGGPLAGLERALLRRLYRRFRVVFVHGEENRRRLRRAFGLAEEKVVAIPHGHELLFAELRDPAVDAAALRRRLRLEAEAPVVLAFGTLAAYKGLDVLVEAFARLRLRVPEARLVIAGYPLPGFDPATLTAAAERLGVAGAVRIVTGYVPTREVAAWMELASVAVFPYRAIFQSGALMVATSFGVPVVASRVGAIPDVVRDGDTGRLVPAGEPAPLADALAELLADPAAAGRLGLRAAAEARQRFDWRKIARRVLAAYRDAGLLPPAGGPGEGGG